jgi:aminopeptidase N
MFMQFLVKGKMEDNNYLEKMAQLTLEKVKKQLKNNSDFASTPIIEYGEKNMTDYSYSKGMLFYYILYHMVGEKAFLDAIKGYYDEFKDTGSTTKEFAEYLKRTFNNYSVDKLINDWIYTNQSSIHLSNSKTIEDLWKEKHVRITCSIKYTETVVYSKGCVN